MTYTEDPRLDLRTIDWDYITEYVEAGQIHEALMATLSPWFQSSVYEDYTVEDLANALIMVVSQYHGTMNRAFRGMRAAADEVDEEIHVPSSDQLRDRLNEPPNTGQHLFGVKTRHDPFEVRDAFQNLGVHQANLLGKLLGWKERSAFGTIDGNPVANFARQSKPDKETEFRQSRMPAFRNHNRSPQPFFRGTTNQTPFHNGAVHCMKTKAHCMVHTEFERPAQRGNELERIAKALTRVETLLYIVLVDREYTQSSEDFTLLQEIFNPLGTFVAGPAKKDKAGHLRKKIREKWDNLEFEECTLDHGEHVAWSLHADTWRSVPGSKPFWILTFFTEVDDTYDEEEEGGFLMPNDGTANMAAFPLILNLKPSELDVQKIGSIRPARWGLEVSFKTNKHETGRSCSSHLFPRQFLNLATYAYMNAHQLWKAWIRKDTDGMYNPKEVTLPVYAARARAKVRKYAKERGEFLKLQKQLKREGLLDAAPDEEE